MTDKEKIIDILLEFYEEYQGNIPNRPMIPSIYASKIIDSLQEWPVSIWHDAVKETPVQGSNILMFRKEEKDTNYPPIAGCFHGTNSRLDGRNWGYYNGFCYNEIEPPVKWAYVDDLLNLSNVERTTKNWKEPVSEELEQAAVEAFKEIVEDERNSFLEIFKAGVNWQKAKLMKDAVDVTVHIDAGGYPYIPQIELYDYDKDITLAKEGDKYRVVLIKEN